MRCPAVPLLLFVWLGACSSPAPLAPTTSGGTDPRLRQPGCGNDWREDEEECDGEDLADRSCGQLSDGGLRAGELACTDDCRFDLSGCRVHTCGNGRVDPDEDCDAENFGDASCGTATDGAETRGILLCDGDCRFDTDLCGNIACGNGKVDGLEECDGEDLSVSECAVASEGLRPRGRVDCTAACDLDLSGCYLERCEGCADAAVTLACDDLVQCDTVPGSDLSASSCWGHMTEACLECTRTRPSLDGGLSTCAGLSSDCRHACADLAEVPRSNSDCRGLLRALLPSGVIDESCACRDCGDSLKECVGDRNCWSLLLCAFEGRCLTLDCLDSCADELGMAGGASASQAAAQLGCLNGCPDPYP